MSSDKAASLENLKKVKIIHGDDMFPSIYSREVLLLDKSLTPRIGDVILFKNRFGVNIAHRLICVVGNYYFTRGDNCIFLNYPCKKNEIRGVVVNKYRDVFVPRFLKLSLLVFLPYYLIYASFFRLQKKDNFIALKIISRLFIPLEGVYYKSDHDDTPINLLIYGQNSSSRLPLKLPPAYYMRRLIDNKLCAVDETDNFSSLDRLKILSSEDIIISHSLEKYCEEIFNRGVITLYDISYLKKLLSNDPKMPSLLTQGLYDSIGLPLLMVYLFDSKYGDKPAYFPILSKFINQYYPKENVIVNNYLEKVSYQMPLKLYSFYNQTKTFKLYSYLSPPVGYSEKNSGYGLFNILIRLAYGVKRYRLDAYMKRPYIFPR